ncbi:hypothetical protein, partial [Salmonella enterica]|uniref:hypothetical protein n=1 Tax=Salmonella enterica TaxID=28901 RepID=UPI001FAC3990
PGIKRASTYYTARYSDRSRNEAQLDLDDDNVTHPSCKPRKTQEQKIIHRDFETQQLCSSSFSVSLLFLFII